MLSTGRAYGNVAAILMDNRESVAVVDPQAGVIGFGGQLKEMCSCIGFNLSAQLFPEHIDSPDEQRLEIGGQVATAALDLEPCAGELVKLALKVVTIDGI